MSRLRPTVCRERVDAALERQARVRETARSPDHDGEARLAAERSGGQSYGPAMGTRVQTSVEADFANTKRITLVLDNSNTDTGAALHKAFEPPLARALYR